MAKQAAKMEHNIDKTLRDEEGAAMKRRSIIEVCRERIQRDPRSLTVYEHEVEPLAVELAMCSAYESAIYVEAELRAGLIRLYDVPVQCV